MLGSRESEVLDHTAAQSGLRRKPLSRHWRDRIRKADPQGPKPSDGTGQARRSPVGPADSPLTRLRKRGEAAKYRTACYVLSHLGVMKVIFAILRFIRPVALFRNVLVVTKASEVREVLERFDDFTLGESIEPGMPWGAFLMTVDGREQHARERRMLQSVVDVQADSHLIRTIVADCCRRRTEEMAESGQIDVVADLAEPAMVAVLAEYLGVPPLGGDPQRMASIMRSLAGIIMVGPAVGSPQWCRSRADIADLTAQLLEQIAAGGLGTTNVGPIPDQSLLARLLRRYNSVTGPKWFDEDWIRRYLTGLVATGGATIVRGTTHAIDQFLEQPEALQQAQVLSAALDRAIRASDRATTDASVDAAKVDIEASRQALRGWTYEALRFRPMLPLLVRHCPRETIIANGTKRARRVPAGVIVIAPPLSAMFDGDAFPDPHAFQERPIESYFHFGFGPRHCFGKYIADIVMIEVVRALMRMPGVTRGGGQKGRVQYDGPAPCSLMVNFSTSRSELRQ
jgi:cytochrome P450